MIADAGLRRIFCNQTKRGNHMALRNIGICAAALVFATMIVSFAQAGGKGTPNHGASTFSPGHETPVPGDHGKSGNAPGDLKNDKTGTKDAKSFAPGQKK